MRVAVDQSWQQCRGAQVDDFGAGRYMYLRRRSNLLDLVTLDKNDGGREYIRGTWIEQSAGFHQSDRSGRLGAQLRHQRYEH